MVKNIFYCDLCGVCIEPQVEIFHIEISKRLVFEQGPQLQLGHNFPIYEICSDCVEHSGFEERKTDGN